MTRKAKPVTIAPATQDRALSEFGEVLKAIRKSKGISQIEVAKRGGLGRGYLGMIETGERGSRPSRDSVLRVSQGLGATDAERDALLRAAGYPPLDPTVLENARISVEEAILGDPSLRDDHRKILLDMYRTLKDTPH